MKSQLIKGTLILTAAGFLSRILGFFYKLLLSNLLGAERLGIYQLIFPIYGLCFTLYAGGIQTAISKFIAENASKDTHTNQKILKKGIFLSLSIALCCSILINLGSTWIASHFLHEPRCASSLRVLSLVFPACSISACINGYYYGIKQAVTPAIAQLLEQSTRIAFSLLFICPFFHIMPAFSCDIAILAIAVGEGFAMLYNVASLFFQKKNRDTTKQYPLHNITKQILLFSIPLTATHVAINLLRATESILIPNMLQLSGLSTKEALSIYGILTGMSMPLLLFPSTIINSITVLLLPSVSEAKATHNGNYIKNAAYKGCFYSLVGGLFATFCFLLFGKQLGYLLFHNHLTGVYLQNLSFLCPFLYISAILSSILHGLGKTTITFRNTILGLSIRILLILTLVSKQGISGYFISLLISQLFSTTLDCISMWRILYTATTETHKNNR